MSKPKNISPEDEAARRDRRREISRNSAKKCRANDREKQNRVAKEFRERHKARLKAKRDENREELNRISRERTAANPEKRRKISRESAARIRGVMDYTPHVKLTEEQKRQNKKEWRRRYADENTRVISDSFLAASRGIPLRELRAYPSQMIEALKSQRRLKRALRKLKTTINENANE